MIDKKLMIHELTEKFGFDNVRALLNQILESVQRRLDAASRATTDKDLLK